MTIEPNHIQNLYVTRGLLSVGDILEVVKTELGVPF